MKRQFPNVRQDMCLFFRIIFSSDVHVNVLSFGLFRLVVLLQKCVEFVRVDNEMSVSYHRNETAKRVFVVVWRSRLTIDRMCKAFIVNLCLKILPLIFF